MVVPGDGFHVREWSAGKKPGEAGEGDLHSEGIFTGRACKHTDSHEEVLKEGGEHWFPCQTCLFVVGYCCVCCKPERP